MDDQKKLKALAVDYLNVFTSPAGERILEDLRVSYGEKGSFDPENPDPLLTAFREGQRSHYLKILFMMEEAQKPEEDES